MRFRFAALAGLAGVLVLSGCGGQDLVVSDQPRGDWSTYDGPLRVPVDDSDDPDPVARSGAAGRAVECAHAPGNGGTGDGWGGRSGGSDAEDGLARFVADSASVPQAGYRVERRQPSRVLFSYDVDGRTKVAVVVADGVRDDLGNRGWGMEVFANCDPAEFRPADAEALGVRIWTDQHGARVPTSTVVSGQGPEHCDWDTATILTLDEDAQFVRDPRGVFGRGTLRTSYDADTALPSDAADTGYRRHGRRLWLARDRSAAYVVSGETTERWPAAKRQLGCA